MSNVMITGITGFIGSRLAEKLLEKGFEVYGIVRHTAARNIESIKPIKDKLNLLLGDISDYKSMVDTFKRANPDVICHLAALTPVRYSFEHPFQYAKYNYEGTMNVVHALMELPDYKNRKLIVASTAEVYGVQETEEPFTEDKPLKPSSPYAVSKAAADMYARMASLVYDMNIVVYRPTNTYGRLFEKRFIIEYLVTTMLQGEKVYVGAPSSIRDFIYIDDHVSAYELAIEKDLAVGEAYNVGSSVGISNKMLAQKIASLVGYDPKDIVLGSYPLGYPFRPIASDQPYLVLNSDKIRKRGWTNKVTLDEGLRKVIKYYRSKEPR